MSYRKSIYLLLLFSLLQGCFDLKLKRSLSDSETPDITDWVFVDGRGANGINNDTSKSAEYPTLAALGSKIYAAWDEPNSTPKYQIRVKAYNGNDDSPSWSDADGGTGNSSVNVDSTENAYTPHLLAFNSKLYAIWTETNTAEGGTARIQVKSYDGSNDPSPTWSAATPNAGLNYDNLTNREAETPYLAALNSTLYAIWAEDFTASNTAKVRAKVYNGGTSWATAEELAQGISSGGGVDASAPYLIPFNSKLYAIWSDPAQGGAQSPINQIHARVNSENWTWNAIDGGMALVGLNYRDSNYDYSNGYNPHLVEFNSKLYAIWTEGDPSGKQQVRVKVYNGDNSSPSWTFVDGNGSTGINKDTGQHANFPQLIVYKSKLYALWAENTSSGAKQIRVSWYHGNDSSPSWAFVDGNGPTGLNKDSSKDATTPRGLVVDNKFYIIWSEGTPGQIVIKKAL
jgi:hypothetical protein